jgi:hypothetical protein
VSNWGASESRTPVVDDPTAGTIMIEVGVRPSECPHRIGNSLSSPHGLHFQVGVSASRWSGGGRSEPERNREAEQATKSNPAR